MRSLTNEFIKMIQMMIEKNLENYEADRTYRAVVKEVNKKGYVILREGKEYTVKCAIPGIELRVGQQVWIKEPMGDSKELHICGVINK